MDGLIETHLDAVVAGQEDAPEFAVFRSLERSITTFDFHGDVLERAPVSVQNEAAHSSMSLADKLD